MPRRYVRNFVRHHSRKFRFFLRPQNQPAVHVEKSARQRKRVHFIGIDHLDREWHLRIRIAHQVLPHAVDVLRHHRVIDHLGTAFHFLRQRFSQRNLVFQRVEIDALAHIPVPDCVHIILRIFRVYLIRLARRARIVRSALAGWCRAGRHLTA